MLGLHRGLPVATAAAFAVLFATCRSASAWAPGANCNIALKPLTALRATTEQSNDENEDTIVIRRRDANCGIAPKPLIALRATTEQSTDGNEDTIVIRRRDVLRGLASAALAPVAIVPVTASAKCTDIETCREIGDRKVDEDMKANPTTALPSGVRYKVLRPPTGRNSDVQAKDGSTVDIAFSIGANGAYMYSKGFGFEKINVDGKKQSDLGLDSLRVKIGNERRDVPLGIEQALMGMTRGERRRIELPPNVGFETSQWRPEPVTKRGKASIASYKRILEGGPNQPAFPAVTYWDVEVLRIKDT